jgi:O-succinylbenzoic acid--CoA ligase
MTGLTLNGRNFSCEWMAQNFRSLADKNFTDAENRTLKFCGEWLSGVERFIVSTSGSTGAPKPISLTREQMMLSARMTGAALNLQAGDRALVCLSPQHIAGLMMLARGLVLDLDLTIVEPSSDPFRALDLKTTPPFDFTALAPLQLQSILVHPQHINFLNKMKAVLVGGAPLSISLQNQIKNLRAPVYQTFGMTETVSHIALRRLNGPHAAEHYQTLPGVEIGQDDRGCLTINSAVTNFRNIITNDVVELISETAFVWLGRIDHVINSGGIKVQAEKVETIIEQILFELNVEHGEFFVGGLPDERYHEKAAAVFTGQQLSVETEAALKAALAKKLNKFELPKEIVYLDSVARTPSGKIDRQATLKKIMLNKL